MKTIKIFLASSDELKDERIAFGDFIRNLDDTYEERGIRIKLIKWENVDSSFNNVRKQEEYNDKIRQCDIIIVLFKTKAGLYTIEEFNVAAEENKKNGSPKIYVFCKRWNSKRNKDTEGLKEFKNYLGNELGYFWCNYKNRDDMQLQFVMQLLKVENSLVPDIKIENEHIIINSTEIANINNLSFAANNKDYQNLHNQLKELSLKTEKVKQRVIKYPNDESFREELQYYLNEFNKLQNELQQEQNNFLDTAIRIAKLQGEKVSERMQRAIDSFEAGEVHKANTILDEAEKDADQHYDDYKHSREIAEQKRQNVIVSIDELVLKASILIYY